MGRDASWEPVGVSLRQAPVRSPETGVRSFKWSGLRPQPVLEEGHAVDRLRKCITEPVFGQIKGGRGFRQFSFRGLAKVTAEWDFVALTHNLLKLLRSGWRGGVRRIIDEAIRRGHGSA